MIKLPFEFTSDYSATRARDALSVTVGGYTRHRRGKGGYISAGVRLTLDAEDYAQLMRIYASDLQQGALPFLCDIRFDDDEPLEVVARFMTAPTVTRNDLFYLVSATIGAVRNG